MSIWFLISLIGMTAALIPYFRSLEHGKLQAKYGREKGKRIGDIYGRISGWGFFLFWIGIWIAPQPRFTIPILGSLSIVVPIVSFSLPLPHLILAVVLLIPAIGIAIEGVKELTLTVSETHRAPKVITTGVYSIVRHPQYFGGLLAHVAISVLLSSMYSLIFTPLVIACIYAISWKEERELIKEFGSQYQEYRSRVAMLLPLPRLGGDPKPDTE